MARLQAILKRNEDWTQEDCEVHHGLRMRRVAAELSLANDIARHCRKLHGDGPKLLRIAEETGNEPIAAIWPPPVETRSNGPKKG
jgi:hypothetical protein